jgi:ketosteroid isomerase-like protein
MKKLSVMLVAVVSVVLVAGCQTSGPSDEELILDLLQSWKTAGEAQDIDALLVLYAEDFQNSEYGDKEGLKGFLKDSKDMGYLSNAEMNVADAKITVEGEKATVYPIEMSASFGTATITLELKKAEGKWMIVGMEVDAY